MNFLPHSVDHNDGGIAMVVDHLPASMGPKIGFTKTPSQPVAVYFYRLQGMNGGCGIVIKLLQIDIVVRSAMAEILAAEYLLDVYIQRANTSKKVSHPAWTVRWRVGSHLRIHPSLR